MLTAALSIIGRLYFSLWLCYAFWVVPGILPYTKDIVTRSRWVGTRGGLLAAPCGEVEEAGKAAPGEGGMCVYGSY